MHVDKAKVSMCSSCQDLAYSQAQQLGTRHNAAPGTKNAAQSHGSGERLKQSARRAEMNKYEKRKKIKNRRKNKNKQQHSEQRNQRTNKR